MTMCDAKEKILYYNFITKTVREGGNVDLDRLCNSYVALNIGTIQVTVNGIPLNPPAAGEVLGDSFTFGALKGEIFAGRVDVQFTAPPGAGGVLQIIQKIYLPRVNSGAQEELNK